MVFGNKSSSDILLKPELEKLQNEKQIKFNLFFTIDTAEPDWKGGVGFISKDMITANLPAPSDDTIMLMCGPPVMCQKVLMPLLLEIGHKKDDIFEF